MQLNLHGKNNQTANYFTKRPPSQRIRFLVSGSKTWHVEFVMTMMSRDHFAVAITPELQLQSGLRSIIRHFYQVEFDTLCHKSVGFAEIGIMTVKKMKKNWPIFVIEKTQIQLGLHGKNNWTAN